MAVAGLFFCENAGEAKCKASSKNRRVRIMEMFGAKKGKNPVRQ